jgi:hypothetical protein
VDFTWSLLLRRPPRPAHGMRDVKRNDMQRNAFSMQMAQTSQWHFFARYDFV